MTAKDKKTTYVAFLRAVNVGGTGRLPMSELRRMCGELGFTAIQTYIASGNVVFASAMSAPDVKSALEAAMREFAGKPVRVAVRSAAKLRRVLDRNPFCEHDPKHTVAIFLDRKPPVDALAEATGRSDEEASVGDREIYVHYPNGIGRSKLRIPAAKEGTARNMNTIAKMVELASGPAVR